MSRFAIVLSFALLVSAQARADLPQSCRFSCSPQCQGELFQLESAINAFRASACNPGPGPAPHPHPGPSQESVALFHSDSCSSQLIAYVGPETDCDSLGSTVSDRVYGVQINGRCHNISDMSFTSACRVFQGGSRGIKIYHSDSCSSELMGMVGRRTNCQEFGQALGSVRAYGVEIGDRCYNIADTSAEAACNAFKGGDRGVKFYHSDSCSSELIAVVSSPADCARMGNGLQRVYGVQIGNSPCQDIADTDFQSACARFAGAR